jgi:hypothetical protein
MQRINLENPQKIFAFFSRADCLFIGVLFMQPHFNLSGRSYFVLLGLSMLLIVGLIFCLAYFNGAEPTDEPAVTCASVLKLSNVQDKSRLHSHDVKYGSGSQQQSVTGTNNFDDVNSHWQILGGK